MRVTSCLALALLVTLSTADDGGIAAGGNPGLLKGNTSVSMASEIVKMDIGERDVHVDCIFTFLNDGPACNVRVGFPDWGIGMLERRGTSFSSFRSWVDGKPVKTSYVKGDAESPAWQAKLVRFRGHGQTIIRDTYVVPVGGFATNYKTREGIRSALYLIHTGASWKGPIGSAKLIATFPSKLVPPPMAATDEKMDWMKMKDESGWPFDAHTIHYTGFAKPKVVGQSLVFERRNFEPTIKDDLTFAFGVIRGHM